MSDILLVTLHIISFVIQLKYPTMKIQYSKFLFVFFSLALYSQGQAQIMINEFSAANMDQFYDNYGDDSDWIELYNAGSTAVDLTGYYLSDKLDNPTKYEIPAGTSIGANDHLLIWASNKNEVIGTNIHTNFKITQTKSSEAIVLADPSGTIIDSHELEIANQVGHAWARRGDGGSEWGVAENPTPDAENFNVQKAYTDTPLLSPEAGNYNGSVEVTLATPDANATIYYTTDGSVPNTFSQQYTGAFTVSNTTVVRAYAVSSDPEVPESAIETNTYFIDESHTIKVISIADESLTELMVFGDWIDAIGSFEYFDEDLVLLEEGYGEYNKHGNDSWAYDQRGIDYISRDEFGVDDAIDEKLFPNKDRDEFQRIMLKAAANDNYPFEDGAHIRDAYVHTLSQLAELEMDERTYEPCILYLNGEYWGVYEIREKVDDNDFTNHYYNQGTQWIDFIKTWGFTWEEYGSWDDWYDLRDFINNNDMTDAASYAYVEERLEVLSLIDYIILHSHNVSADWLNWNTAWWRGRKPTGGALKWRYILWDEDATFGHYINYTNIPDQGSNADPCNPEQIDPFTDFEGHIEIFSDLFENEDFKQLYINRYADLNNTYFSCDFMIPLLDDMIARIEPEMARHTQRWGGSVSGWQDNVQDLRDFISNRCTIIDEGIVDCYEDEGITGPYDITINVEPPLSGKVKANTLVGLSYPWQATYFGGVNVTLEAIPEDGFIFDHWEVSNTVFGPDEFAQVIELSFETGDEITAYFFEAVPCVSPSNLQLDSTFNSAELAWNGPASSLSYQVRYRELNVGDDWTDLSVIDDTYQIIGLQSCAEYELQLRTICPSALSDYIYRTFETACATSVSEIDNSDISKVNIYPNPFTNHLTIDYTLAKTADITIDVLSLAGQQVQTQSYKNQLAGEQKLNLTFDQALPNGMYLIRIFTNDGLVIKRVVKD